VPCFSPSTPTYFLKSDCTAPQQAGDEKNGLLYKAIKMAYTLIYVVLPVFHKKPIVQPAISTYFY